MKKLKDLLPEIKDITFKEFMIETGGSGEIYNDVYGEILEAAINATESDWVRIMDFVCPIVDEVLIETVQESPEIYHDLMVAIRHAHLQMMQAYYKKLDRWSTT